MRVLVLVLAFLALPAALAAQQAELRTDATTPRVELQQSVPAATATADVAGEEARDGPVTVDSRRAAEAPAAAQSGDPSTARWWWLVPAIVVGGVILAAIL